MNLTKLKNQLIMKDGHSMMQFNKTVESMVVNSRIILMRRDKEQERQLRELWMETNAKMFDLFEEFN